MMIILRKRGNGYTVNNNLLQELQRQLQPDIPIQATRCQLQHSNYRNYILSVRESIYQTPNLQLRNKHRIRRKPQQIVGYDRIINTVQQRQDQRGNQPEPMLVAEVEEEDQAQQHQQHPYL
jgi:hypothetical protein